MFGSLGATEILVLAVIGLLVFGPRRLPEMGRTLGKTLYEFRKAAMELRTSIEREINLEELKQAGQSIREGVREGAGLLAPPAIAATPNTATPTAPAPPLVALPEAPSTSGDAAPDVPAAPRRPTTLAEAVEATPMAPPWAAPARAPAVSDPSPAEVPGMAPRPDSPRGTTDPQARPDEAPGTGNVVPKH